jgi:hypothetical protein
MYALWGIPSNNARLAWNYSSEKEVSLNMARVRINALTLLVSPLPKKVDRKKQSPKITTNVNSRLHSPSSTRATTMVSNSLQITGRLRDT